MDNEAQESFASPMRGRQQLSEGSICFVSLAFQDNSLILGHNLNTNGGVIAKWLGMW